MTKTVRMQLESANALLTVADTKGIVVLDNSVRLTIGELKEIISMYNYLNQPQEKTMVQNTTNF